MRLWLRKVVPDLFLAAVVALVVTIVMNHFDVAEAEQIRTDVRTAAAYDGLTLDERLGAFEDSIRRSTLMHLPILIALSGMVVGLVCRNRRWVWLTAIGAVLAAVMMGVAFFVDRPVRAGSRC